MTEAVFPDHDRDDWRVAAERFLKGKPFETLVRETDDGIARGPLFTRADLPRLFAALPRADVPLRDERPWHILAPVRDPDVEFANTQLLEDLRGGASAVRICAGEGEVPIARRADLRRLLEGVFTDLVPISFSPNDTSQKLAKLAIEMEDFHTAHVRLGLDPARVEAIDLDALPATWRAFTLSPRHMHEHGATEAQELAAMAAATAAAMRRFGAETAHRHLIVELASDQDAHLGIAKLRAARRIYARIAESFGLSDTAVEIHAIGSKRMMQAADPWTNLLRVMNAGFGAVVGGADFVLTRPFTDGFGRATPFAHRIARNMQLLMMEESYLGQVNDAAFGSYWHEHMTDALAREAWAKFQAIEAMGGWAEYRASGALQSDLERVRSERAERPIVGVTLHPMPDNVPMPEVRA